MTRRQDAALRSRLVSTLAASLPVLAVAAPPAQGTATTGEQEAYIKASNSDDFDYFGRALAIDGDLAVVGARHEDSDAAGVGGDDSNNSGFLRGAVYVFRRSGTTWVQEAYLKASNPDDSDQFGVSVAVSGGTIVVGAWGEDSGATGVDGDQTDDSAPGSGAAYVFVKDETGWSQQAYLKASNTGAGDLFGLEVAISGDTIAVAADEEASAATVIDGNQADDTASSAGAVYVFRRTGTAWLQEAYVKASNTEANDAFGTRLALDGDVLVVGAPGESSAAIGVDGDQSDNSAFQAGAAYAFRRSGSAWTQEAYLKASNAEQQDLFGADVSVQGDTIAVGATLEDSAASGVGGDQADNTRLQSGAVYVFRRAGGAWTQEAYLKAPDPGQLDAFGYSLDLGDDRLLVGAYAEDSSPAGGPTDNSTFQSGAAFTFSRTGTSWYEQSYLKASNPDLNDQFGIDVALSGSTALVGAYVEASNADGIDGDQTDNSVSGSGAAYAILVSDFLETDTIALSLSAGGSQVMQLDGGAARAGWFYWIFGSATGVDPGLDLGGGLILPLNFDGYFKLTLERPNAGIFSGFLGLLDLDGLATASLTIPPGSDPSLAGVTLHHAFLAAQVFGIAEFASNPIAVELAP